MHVEGDRISAIEAAAGGEDLPFIAPGLVDLQINGYAGYDLNAPGLSAATVSSLARVLLELGVTRFIPTLITGSEADIIGNLAAISRARETDAVVRAMTPFVHVEGPHIAEANGPRGAHPHSAVRAWDIAEFDRWQAACGAIVGMVTMSPHRADAIPYIAALNERGVHVAIGHSDASSEQIHDAAGAGAVLSTHLGNGLAANLPRHPNLLWAQLADDRLTATFIADGHHLPADTLKAMIRAKGLDRSILVSDTVALGGMQPGRYDTAVGGEVELGVDGRLSLAGTPYLAGAALPLFDAIPLVMRDVELSLAQAMRLVTVNPARFAGGGAALAVGERADLFCFRLNAGGKRFALDGCWLAGRAAAML